MNSEQVYYVYRYFDPCRAECIYIGKGKNKRAFKHLTRKDMSPFVQRLQKMKREGVEPIVDFICTGVDEEFAFLVEQEAIAKYGRRNIGLGTLLNLTDGGDGTFGYKYTAEQCLHVASATKEAMADDKVREKCATGRKGKNNSAEHVMKAAAPHLGAKRSEETKNSMSLAQQEYARQPEAQAKYKAAWDLRRLRSLERI